MKGNQIVIVIDTGNYQTSEPIPFKAILVETTEYPCYVVRSVVTGNEYELYEHQILEMLDAEHIALIIDLSRYGDWN